MCVYKRVKVTGVSFRVGLHILQINTVGLCDLNNNIEKFHLKNNPKHPYVLHSFIPVDKMCPCDYKYLDILDVMFRLRSHVATLLRWLQL